jgi:hypothetical protein
MYSARLRSSRASLVCLGLGLYAAAGCGLIANLPGGTPLSEITPPQVTFLGATLAQAPSQRQLAAYYCPVAVNVPFGGAAILCEGLFGPRPAPAALATAFDLRFKVANPNRIPLPVASVLAAVTVFPGAGNQQLGAVCLQLCSDGPGCTPRDTTAACTSSARDIRSLSDFQAAAPGLLIAAGMALANGQTPSFTAPALAAGAETEVVARFSFGPTQLLGAMQALASQSASELRAGRFPSFTIPYSVEGTVWFDAGTLGRIAVGYGPITGVWALPVN